MKIKLLFTLSLLITFLGYSQTHDNIPTGTGIYINKLIPSPSGDDLINEYLEIRGTANAVVPSDLYLISIEGDGNSSSRGKVSEAIQLGDGTRTFGSNGILAIVANYTQDSGGSTTLENLDGAYASPYVSIINTDATVIDIALTGNDLGSSSSSAVSTISPDIGYDGNFIDPAATYMLVAAASNPKGKRIDGTADSSDANGVINATGDHTSWVLYDSISYLDDDDVDAGENGEYAYGQIVYAQNNAIHSTKHFITTSAVIVDFATTSDANYMLRQGTKTGYSANDWIVSANSSSSSVPNWVFSTSSSKCYPDAFLGWDGINAVYGGLNPTAEALSTEDILASEFKVYPNPVRDILNVETNNLEITGVTVFDILGKNVIPSSVLKNSRVDVSSLNKGVYFMKMSVNGTSVTKKIIIE
jgi:hypothetical protein